MNDVIRPTFFPVYASIDIKRVRSIVDALRNIGVDVWMESEKLRPGSSFQSQIIPAIKACTTGLVFISSAMAESKHLLREVILLDQCGKIIIPVIIERVPRLPPALEYFFSDLRQIDLTKYGSNIPFEALEQINDSVRNYIPHNRSFKESDKTDKCIKEIAETHANSSRKVPPTRKEASSPPTSAFIVHGHDDDLFKEVEEHLSSLGVESIVLRRIGGPAQSLFQKFLQWGKDTRFALVLISADDLGASRSQYDADGVGTHALQFRARQNIILELGFFYGHLGWENVFVLFKEPDKGFPNFEMPSDLGGVVFDRVEESGEWKEYLEHQLKEAGFVIEQEITGQSKG